MTGKFLDCLREELNPEQYEAVTHDTGPLLVLAGAGSGKTRVLAYRLAYLLAAQKCRPHQVLAVTFTNKAADEMRARIEGLIGELAENVMMGTFHRIGVNFLRRYGDEISVSRNFDIADDTASKILIKRIMRHENDIDYKKEDPRSYQYAISSAKVALKTPEEYEAQAFDNWTMKVAKVYRKYAKGLDDAKSLDFDDLIMKTVELVESGGPASIELMERFRFILVDEYQDVNFAQYRLIKALAGNTKDLTVVGDDDQAIYGFRGADTSFILNFHTDFPDAKVVKLERNYRSTGNILKCANIVVVKNYFRREKLLWTDADVGELIFLYPATNEEDEAHFCAATIEDLVKAGKVSYKDCAILYRTNSQSRSFEEVFSHRRIPHQIIGGMRFYKRQEIQDVIAYLQVINNPDASMALERIINVPPRGIGPVKYLRLIQLITEAQVNIMEIATDDGLLLRLDKYRKALEPFLKMMRFLYDMRVDSSVYALTVRMLEESSYLKKLTESESIDAEARIENIAELLGAIKRFDEKYPTQGLPAFLEEVALISDVDKLERNDDSVKIMTAHSSKGLEFEVVFLTGLEEGLFPHSRSLSRQEDIEEERRLCYVGITRAKSRLYFSFAQKRLWMGKISDQVPSRFFREIPENLIQSEDPDFSFEACFGEGVYLSRGYGHTVRVPKTAETVRVAKETAPSAFMKDERVTHETFGEGSIVDVRDAGGDHFLLIRFDDHGTRLLSENKAPLQKIKE